MRVDPAVDKIAVDGVRIEIREDRVTYAINKPPGVITAMSDDRNRPTVGDMVGDLARGLVHVGRLDQDTEGLLLLTTDGELAHRLAHPSYEVRKTYLAQVSGSVPRDLQPPAARRESSSTTARSPSTPSGSSTPTPAGPWWRWYCTRAASTSCVGCSARSGCRCRG